MERFEVVEDKLSCILSFIGGIALAGFGFWKIAQICLEHQSISFGDILAMIFLLLLLFLGCAMICGMNDFCITVEGERIHIKRSKKKEYDITVQDIDKVVCHEKPGRRTGLRFLLVDIRFGDNKVTITELNKGFLEMLEYLQRQYDDGNIKKSAIKELNYKKLLAFQARCREGKFRKRRTAKSE